MTNTLVVVDRSDLNLFEQVNAISFEQYLSHYPKKHEQKTRVINLCQTDIYLSQGYYCSLLAEARRHTVIPKVSVINEVNLSSEHAICLPFDGAIDGQQVIASLFPKQDESEEHCVLYLFGESDTPEYQALGKQLFARYSLPIMMVSIDFAHRMVRVRNVPLASLDTKQLTSLQQALVGFVNTHWRRTKRKKQARWDMAILVDPDESTPPSDKVALNNFIKAAQKVGIHAELISAQQANDIALYDALFIRETTAIDHHTYKLARAAEQEGLVVIDDPDSILRCCNKVYLQDAFSYNKVPSARTQFVADYSIETCSELVASFGLPMVLKLPESAFSKGVYKVDSVHQLQQRLNDLLQQSALVLVQEYIYTEFDWRIGVLGGKPIYACKYHMARGHWQIYNHASAAHFSGDFETIPTFEVPHAVLQAAVKAAKMVGNGLYGVDIKQQNNQVYVIEVNDNPSIESRVEDKYLGKELYMLIMQEFANRLEMRGR